MNERPNVFPSKDAAEGITTDDELHSRRARIFWDRYYRMRKLRLTFELVPVPLHGKNLHSVMSRQEWDKLRREVYRGWDYRCGVCGASGQLVCHEVWDYDDVNHIQTLGDLIPLCKLCNYIKHFGLAQILAAEGKINLDKVIQHFLDVNQCDYDHFMAYKQAAFFVHGERCKFEWKQDWQEYEYLRSGIEK